MDKGEQQSLPCPVMGFLLRRILDGNLPPDCPENRTRIGMLEGWVGTVLSLVLCVVKGWLGLVSGSVSLIADATNNLTDMGSSLVVALGFQWSRKPSDEDHPFGHGRIDRGGDDAGAFDRFAFGRLRGGEVGHCSID